MELYIFTGAKCVYGFSTLAVALLRVSRPVASSTLSHSARWHYHKYSSLSMPLSYAPFTMCREAKTGYTACDHVYEDSDIEYCDEANPSTHDE